MRSSRLMVETLEDRCLLAARFTELAVPPASVSLEGITAGPDGNLWYTSFNSSRIGRVTPAGLVTEFEAGSNPNSGPVGITVGPDGNLWYAMKNAGLIGRITPNGVVTEFAASAVPASGPEGITAGPDGNLWYSLRFAGRIGRITPAGAVTEFPITTSSASQPVGITTGPDGNLWFVEHGANRIGRITLAGQITEYDLPTPNAGPFAIVTGPDGNLWFTERNAHQIGRITTAGRINEIPIPTLNTQPVGITPGPDGNVWFTERNSGKLGQVTPAGQIIEIDVTTPNAQPHAITFGVQRSLVFTQLGMTANRVVMVDGLVDPNRGFIQALYRRSLGRFGSPFELESWASYLAGTQPWVVANAIERSPEARTRLVKSWYVQHLGRVAVSGEEQGWVQLMLHGISEEQILTAILNSPEYYNRTVQILGVSGPATDAHLIQALFRQVLGRPAGEAEVVNLRSNLMVHLGRHGLIWVILNSEEHRGNVIRSYYRSLLGRPGAPATAEVRAWVFAQPWLDLATIRVGFMASPEFYQNA